MRRALAALAAVLAVVLTPPLAARAVTASVTAAQAPRSRLVLTGQNTYVGANGELLLRLRLDRSGLPATTELAVSVYRSVQTRSEFQQTLAGTMSRGLALPVSTFPLAGLTPDASGDVTVRIQADLGDSDGVYPVRVEMRERGGSTIERFVTHLVYLTGSHSGPKMAMAMVLPVRTGLSLPPDGPRQIPGLDDLVATVGAFESIRSLPFVLRPSPETVAALDASNDDRAGKVLDGLRRLSTDHPVAAGPYVPVSLASLLQAGLQDELGNQMIRGANVLSDVLHLRPDARTWIESEPLDPESVDALVRRGVERIVAAEPVLEPVPELSLTLSRPFVLGGREQDVPGVVADEGLSAHFTGGDNQVLAAHHLLADLAVLWLDAPAADRRAVIAMPPPDWSATRPFVDALSAGLTQNPVVEPVSLDTVFTTITPAVTSRGSALVRHPAAAGPGGVSEVVGELRQARGRLTSLETVLAATTPSSKLLEERLLVAESSELRGPRPRQAYLSAVETGIADHVGAIAMPQGRSITLTARRAQIPVTFQNRTGAPVRVVVTVQSDKLEFPDGTSRPLELARRNTTERFSVVARTSGAFPLRITLRSPDGNLLIGRARLTVRSTAASRVSLIVSLSAALFLVVWWGRHVVKGRRARRLVPA